MSAGGLIFWRGSDKVRALPHKNLDRRERESPKEQPRQAQARNLRPEFN
jgi:hypothetical protein